MCTSSGMQLAMLSDDVKKASWAERSKNSLSTSDLVQVLKQVFMI